MSGIFNSQNPTSFIRDVMNQVQSSLSDTSQRVLNVFQRVVVNEEHNTATATSQSHDAAEADLTTYTMATTENQETEVDDSYTQAEEDFTYESADEEETSIRAYEGG